jgi:Zn-dependent metalloprotease
MKRKSTKILAGMAMVVLTTQLTTMALIGQVMPKLPHCIQSDPQGFFKFQEGKLPAGACFGALKDSLLKHSLETVRVSREWTDSILLLDHVKYQQYYDGIMVEGGEFIEHSKHGYLVMANGKLAHNFPTLAVPPIPEAEAMNKLLTYLGVLDYAWLHPSWEAQIKADTGDSAATYYPKGTLMWSVDHRAELGFNLDGSLYRLGWRFEILTLGSNSQHRYYFVDAQTGEIYRQDELRCSNGPANILTQGSRTIDTKPVLFDHKLQADDGGRNIVTKYYEGFYTDWSSMSHIKDNDDDWGSDEQLGTTAHWMVMQAWDFFKWQYGLNGTNGTGEEVRVYAGVPDTNSYRDFGGMIELLYFGSYENYMAVADVVGHEYTHGVTGRSSNLFYGGESGALNESFSDIFGTMVERYAQGGTYNWEFCDAATALPYRRRSLAAPTTLGGHYAHPGDCDSRVVGQPEYYKGPNWYDVTNSCDYGGVHVNSGVQNRWFYLLSEGGAATPAVTGIGIDKAAQIAFYSLTNLLTSASQYSDARIGGIFAADLLYGYCSNEYVQTTNAWAVVGLGPPSNCTIQQDESSATRQAIVYPNPTAGQVVVKCDRALPDEIKVCDLSGKALLLLNENLLPSTVVDLSQLGSGVYILSVKVNGSVQNQKVIRQ